MILINDKIIVDHQKLNSKINEWRKNGEKIVFTNGCFDLIHIGHVQYLTAAKNLGTKLVVALNADASVSRLKGPNRPLQNEESRLNIMASFEFSDIVTLFDDDTPYELIKFLNPNILVKGGDWPVESIVGSDWVLKNGGTVLSLPFLDGQSTTLIEQKIIKNYLTGTMAD